MHQADDHATWDVFDGTTTVRFEKFYMTIQIKEV